MNFKTLITIFASASIITGLCLRQNARQSARATRAKAELSIIASQHLPIESEVAKEKEKFQAVEKEITSLKRSVALISRIEFVDGTLPEKPEETAKKESDSIADQEQKARAYRARLVAQYAPFYYRAGLSNEQIDRLETMLTDHWQSTADIKAIAELKKLKDDDPAVAELRAKADQTLQRAESKLLGKEGRRRLKDYERELPARDFTASVVEKLYFTDTPLNAAQAEKLTQLLAANNEPFKKGQQLDLHEMDWVKVLDQIPAILSPEQQTAFLSAYEIYDVMSQPSLEMFEKKLSPLMAALKGEAKKKE